LAATTGTGQIATRYANALIDMAEKAAPNNHGIEKIEKDFDSLAAMIAGSKDLQSLIRNPLLNRSQQQGAILAIAEKAGFDQLTFRFLGVLAQNRRLPILNAVIKALKSELNRRRGGVEAKVQTAFALSPEQTATLQKSLSDAMGSHVTLNVEVNRDILGGMIVTVGSRMIDDSVRRKLERLKRTLSGTRAA
jgi:F-type H+-transporting ATPase subunit delta